MERSLELEWMPQNTRGKHPPSDHDSIVEAQVQNRLTVVNESIQWFSVVDVPDANGGIAGAGDDNVVIVLKTEHRACVARERHHAGQIGAFPDLQH